jgi:hypothetical protein
VVQQKAPSYKLWDSANFLYEPWNGNEFLSHGYEKFAKISMIMNVMEAIIVWVCENIMKGSGCIWHCLFSNNAFFTENQYKRIFKDSVRQNDKKSSTLTVRIVYWLILVCTSGHCSSMNVIMVSWWKPWSFRLYTVCAIFFLFFVASVYFHESRTCA